jgi:hypothetical protein
MKGFKRGFDVWLLGQDPETSFRMSVRPQIPLAHNVACHLVALLPDSIPEVLGQGDDVGELLQQERVEPLLLVSSPHYVLASERGDCPRDHSCQPDP